MRAVPVPGTPVRTLLTRWPTVASDAENLRKVANEHG